MSDVDLAKRIDAAEAARAERATRIHRSWLAYEGERPTTSPEPDLDQIRLNLAGLIVDTGVDFLFGQDITVDVDDDREHTTEDQWLTDAWGRRRMTTLQAAAINGAVSGHAWLRISPHDGANPRQTPPRILPLDPANIVVLTAADDIDDVQAQVIYWGDWTHTATGPQYRQVLTPETETSWLIVDSTRDGSSGKWVETRRERWPHSWSPVVGCQNLLAPGRYYGRPDLTRDVLDTQDAVNDSLSSTRRKERLQNKRLLVGKGLTPEAEGALEEGDVVLLPDGESDLYGIDAASGQVRDSLELYRTVKAALHEISRVPEIAAGRLDNIGQLSGLALQILYGPLLRKTESKRRLYGGLVSDVSACMLELAGFGDSGEQAVAVRWPAILPTDDEAEARTALLRQDAGVSVGTTISELGYDPEAEAKARADESLARRDQADRMFDRGDVDA